MIPTGASTPAGKTIAVVAIVVTTLVLIVLAGLAMAWIGLGLPPAKLDPLLLPRFFWYYRHDPKVTAWLWRGLAIAALIVGGGAIALFRPRRPLHGAARFAGEGEIRREGLRAGRGIILGRKNGRYLMFGGSEHVLLEAPTRSGKGVGIVIPNLLTWPDSVVVLDIKRENWDATAGFRARHGQKVFLFNPTARDRRTARYNPLGHIDRESPDQLVTELQKIATMLFPPPEKGDPFWTQGAMTGFVGVGALVAADGNASFTIGEIYRRMTAPATKDYLAGELKRLGDRVAPNGRRAVEDFIGGADNTVAGLKQTITSKLNLWLDAHVDAATSASDFDLRTVRQRRTSIYLGVSPDELERVAPLYNLFFQQLLDLNTRELAGDDNDIGVLVLLDEFARLGRASVIANGFSYVAGYGFRLLPVIQSRSQLRAVYGNDVADEIVANCGIEIAFTPKELKVANELSERIGYVGQRQTTKSLTIHGMFANRSRSESDQRRALLMPQELMQFPRDDMLILRGGMAPVRARKIRYYASRFFTARISPPPDVPIAPAPVSQSTSADDETRLPTDDELALVTPVDLAAIEAPAGSIFGDLSRHDISAGIDRLEDTSLLDIGIKTFPTIFGSLAASDTADLTTALDAAIDDRIATR